VNTTRDAYYFTAGGLARFRARLEAARAAYRAICDDNPAAREAGDSSVWHDNFAFEGNQRLMHQLARRVRELEHVLEQAEVVTLGGAAPDRVTLGVRVVYRLDDDREARWCVIVGYDEGAPKQRRVAYDAPLGRALLGARVGDERELELAGGMRWARVESIELDRDEEVVTCAAT